MKSLVLFSGGLDSTVALAQCLKEDTETPTALSFYYGQRHSRELEAGREVAALLGAPRETITIKDLLSFAPSLLVGSQEQIPQLSYQELRATEGPSPAYVPYRNGLMLSIATSYALQLEFDQVVIAVHSDDAHNWAYPDCTPAFVEMQRAAIEIGTYHKVTLSAPFSWRTKAEVVLLGQALKVPFEKTYSCYEGRRQHCSLCPTCVSRIEAFKQAKVGDPTFYEGL